MLSMRCIDKYRDNNGNIVGYLLQPVDGGEVREVVANLLKQQIATHNIEVVNLKLTSDNRLISIPDQSKQFDDDELYKSDINKIKDILMSIYNHPKYGEQLDYNDKELGAYSLKYALFNSNDPNLKELLINKNILSKPLMSVEGNPEILELMIYPFARIVDDNGNESTVKIYSNRLYFEVSVCTRVGNQMIIHLSHKTIKYIKPGNNIKNAKNSGIDVLKNNKEFIEKLDSAVKLILNNTKDVDLEMPRLLNHTYKSNKFIFADKLDTTDEMKKYSNIQFTSEIGGGKSTSGISEVLYNRYKRSSLRLHRLTNNYSIDNSIVSLLERPKVGLPPYAQRIKLWPIMAISKLDNKYNVVFSSNLSQDCKVTYDTSHILRNTAEIDYTDDIDSEKDQYSQIFPSLYNLITKIDPYNGATKKMDEIIIEDFIARTLIEYICIQLEPVSINQVEEYSNNTFNMSIKYLGYNNGNQLNDLVIRQFKLENSTIDDFNKLHLQVIAELSKLVQDYSYEYLRSYISKVNNTNQIDDSTKINEQAKKKSGLMDLFNRFSKKPDNTVKGVEPPKPPERQYKMNGIDLPKKVLTDALKYSIRMIINNK